MCKKTTILFLMLIALVAALPALSACHYFRDHDRGGRHHDRGGRDDGHRSQ